MKAERHERDEEVSRLSHLDQERRAETKRDHGKQLIGQTEERPEAC